MFSPSRDEVRQFFCEVWRKHPTSQPLLGAEQTALGVVLQHPEYHALLTDPAAALAREWTPEGGAMNPFLHLSLHLAIAEQLSIDQPPGIRAAFARLLARMETHDAEHVLLETLAETLWAAQRQGQMPDTQVYLDAILKHST